MHEVARFERGTHQRAADALTIDLERSDLLESKPCRGPLHAASQSIPRDCGQSGSPADDDPARPSRLTSRSSTKSAAPRRLIGSSKFRHTTRSTPQAASAPSFSRNRVRAPEPPRPESTREASARMSSRWPGRRARARVTGRPRSCTGDRDARVVVADRQHATAVPRPQVMQTPNQFHRSDPATLAAGLRTGCTRRWLTPQTQQHRMVPK